MLVSTALALGPADLYPRFARFVRRALTRSGVRSMDVDDLTHEVFVTLHRKGCTFANEAAARAWLWSAARRIASNDRRGRARAERRPPRWSPAEPPSPELAVARVEAAAMLERFAGELPAPARAVFELSEVEGMTAPEIADTLGLPLNTTYSHIRRVRQRFARTIVVAVGLLLLLVAMLCVGCTVEATADGQRVAVRGPAHDPPAAAARR